MKKLFTIGLITAFSAASFAQDSDASAMLVNSTKPIEKTDPGQSCYQKWDNVFSERGATAVEDGVHKNVIITVRTETGADCYMGQAVVGEGIVQNMYAMVEGGKFEIFLRKYQHYTPLTISNGVSKSRITVDNELVNVMFIDNIKPKQKAMVKAPDPQLE